MLILHYRFTCYVKLELWHINLCIERDKLSSFSGFNNIVFLSFSCTYRALPLHQHNSYVKEYFKLVEHLQASFLYYHYVCSVHFMEQKFATF